jgi:hypothetical protein
LSFTRAEINEYLESIGESALLADGFDEALIGFSQRINEPILAVYDYEKMVQILMDNDGLSYDDAVEYLDYNVVGAWMGEQTPIIVMPVNLLIS